MRVIFIVLLLEKALEERLLPLEVQLSLWCDLDTICFNDEVDNLPMLLLKDAFSDLFQLFFKLVRFSFIILFLIDLLVFHEHERNGQIKNEERANPNANDEEGVHKD
jgi:hypothetical protein